MTTDATIDVEVVTTESAFCALEPEWNSLLARSSANTLFLTWEWVWTWWQVYGHDATLHVLVAREAGRIVGLGPLCRRRHSFLGVIRWQAIAFIGAGGDVTPEYLDFILPCPLDAGVAEALARQLAAAPDIDEFDLHPFRSDSPLLDLVQRQLARTGVVRRRPGPRCPVMALPATVEAFMASRSRNYRKKLGEYRRRATRHYSAIAHGAATADEVTRGLATLRRLHERRWEGRSRAFQSTRYITFHERLAHRLFAHGWLRLYTLESSVGTLACVYGYAYGGRYLFYQSGRDPEFAEGRVGLLLMHEVILDAIREGLVLFDFLSGEEAYKYRWATGELGSDRLVCWRRLSPRLAAAAHRATYLLTFTRGLHRRPNTRPAVPLDDRQGFTRPE